MESGCLHPVQEVTGVLHVPLQQTLPEAQPLTQQPLESGCLHPVQEVTGVLHVPLQQTLPEAQPLTQQPAEICLHPVQEVTGVLHVPLQQTLPEAQQLPLQQTLFPPQSSLLVQLLQDVAWQLPLQQCCCPEGQPLTQQPLESGCLHPVQEVTGVLHVPLQQTLPAAQSELLVHGQGVAWQLPLQQCCCPEGQPLTQQPETGSRWLHPVQEVARVLH